MIRTRSEEKEAFDLATRALGCGEPGVTLTDDGTRAELSLLGIRYARIERTGRGVEVAFLVQEADRRRPGLDVGFRPDSIRPDWLRIRLGKEPRRWREADVAGLVARSLSALRTIANVGRWRSITSTVGRFVVMPKSAVARWPNGARTGDSGVAPSTGTSRIEGSWGSGLLLEGGGTLYAQPSTGGLVLIRATMRGGDDEHLLRNLLADLPDEAFAPTGIEIDVLEPLTAFDAARTTTADSDAAHLECPMDAGRYRVATASYEPNASVSLALVRLSRD